MSHAPLGACWIGEGVCSFSVWAPRAERVEVVLRERVEPLTPGDSGYFGLEIGGLRPGDHYGFRLDGAEVRPDPASRFQPDGVHAPSEIVDPSFPWTDAAWRGLALADQVFYEVHVGAFSREGTFDAVVPHLDGLRDLGVTTIELMPVAAFPGRRNWGYDGVLPWSVHAAYGGPDGLRRLVAACHRRGLALCLDVVYNHLGPEGNVLRSFGPYFTDRYRTPWGDALNFDGPGSDEVRRYFVENARHWIEEYHVDALRLDAVHAIVDVSARPFLEELATAVQASAKERGWPAFLIAEDDRNDPRTVRPASQGGLGMDAQWNDDFHHALHALVTGEREGYYADFGSPEQLAKAFREPFVLTGGYSAFRGRRHGRSAMGLPATRFVACIQNHDQVGNRMLGERLDRLVSFESRKLAAAALLLSPYLPLLFMGEEYGEAAPFLYFTDHGDPDLARAVREGRRKEFEGFRWKEEPPDPQDPATFRASRLDPEQEGRGRHRVLRTLYATLLGLRREYPATEADATTSEGRGSLVVLRRNARAETLAVLCFGEEETAVSRLARGRAWRKVLDTADARWDGPGAVAPDRVEDGAVPMRPESAVLYMEA